MRARLTIVRGEGTPREWELGPDQPVTLGRSRENTITLVDEHVSRLHAKVFHEEHHWHLRDFGTLNGTKLDGELIDQEALLRDGQVIGIGEIQLRFTLGQPG